jgi:hypothetical protein
MRRLTSLLMAAVALSLVAVSAQGQIPNPLRKAKDKARQAATGQPAATPSGQPKFDETMLQLNAQNVARLIKGLEVRTRMKGPGGLTAQQLRERGSAAAEEANTLNNEHGNERFEFNNKKGEAENCVSEKMGEYNHQHNAELQRRIYGMVGVNTPEKTAFMQEYMAIAQEQAQAIQNPQDTATINRLAARQNKLLGIDPKADSLKARTLCKVPPAPPRMRRADSLAAWSDSLYAQARAAEAQARDASARAAEMTPEQFAMALERAEAFVLAQPGSRSTGAVTLYVWTPTEQDALRAQLAVLKRYLG